MVHYGKKAVKAFYRGMDIDDRYYYIRAYLGLADSMEYPQLNDTIVSIKSNSIERCPSPIYYKFWEGYVYVFLKIEGQESLGGETFMFTLKNENNKQKSSDENTFFIKVPKGLNLRDFFNEGFKNWEKL